MQRLLIVLAATLLFTAGLPTTDQAQAAGTVAILMPGAAGAVPSDFLIRNRQRFTRAGIRTKVTTSPTQAVTIAKAERARGNRVVIVGMSRGTIHTAQALASGAPVSRAVFVSGNFKAVMSILGTPARLPPTLVVHERYDRCHFTTPRLVPRFLHWSHGKAHVRWIDTRGRAAPNPCGPYGAHGYYRHDGPAVAAIIRFIR